LPKLNWMAFAAFAGVIHAAHVPGTASAPGGYPGKICSPVREFLGPA